MLPPRVGFLSLVERTESELNPDWLRRLKPATRGFVGRTCALSLLRNPWPLRGRSKREVLRRPLSDGVTVNELRDNTPAGGPAVARRGARLSLPFTGLTPTRLTCRGLLSLRL